MPLPASGLRSSVLDDLAEVIGEASVRALAWEFRGIRLYIPTQAQTNPGIERAIGRAAAERLCSAFGGTVVPIPFAAVVNARVRELAAQHMKKKDIAQACCISEPRVYAILAKAEADEAANRQMKLL